MTNTTAYLNAVNIEQAAEYLETELGFMRSRGFGDVDAKWAWTIDDNYPLYRSVGYLL